MRIILMTAAALFLGGVAVHPPQASAKPPGRTAVCHRPPDNPDNVQILLLPEAAVQAHLNHGDVLYDEDYACLPPPPPPL